jgi:ADP-glucose pyrophosphorylase
MDSIIFKSNSIGSNSTVDNTIMFNGCTIGNNVVIKNALIDKNVIIKDSVSIISTSNNPIYIKKGSVISESCTL